jgi:hypothetical protein
MLVIPKFRIFCLLSKILKVKNKRLLTLPVVLFAVYGNQINEDEKGHVTHVVKIKIPTEF